MVPANSAETYLDFFGGKEQFSKHPGIRFRDDGGFTIGIEDRGRVRGQLSPDSTASTAAVKSRRHNSANRRIRKTKTKRNERPGAWRVIYGFRREHVRPDARTLPSGHENDGGGGSARRRDRAVTVPMIM